MTDPIVTMIKANINEASTHISNMVEYKGELYWAFRRSTASQQILVARYKASNDTATVIPSINYVSVKNGGEPRVIVYNNVLFVVWTEVSDVGTHKLTRLKSFDGTTWTIYAALNYDITKGSNSPSMTVYDGKLYIAWSEYTGTVYHLRLKSFDGTDWVVFPEPLNYDTAKSTDRVRIIEYSSKLYIAWIEAVTSKANNLMLQSYDGTNFTVLSTALDDTDTNDVLSHDIAVTNQKLVTTWGEYFGGKLTQVLREYDGTTFANALKMPSVSDAQTSFGTLVPDGAGGLYIFLCDEINTGVFNVKLWTYYSPTALLESYPALTFNNTASNSVAMNPAACIHGGLMYISWAEANILRLSTMTLLAVPESYLYKDGTDIKTYSAGVWTTIGSDPVTDDMFTNSGMTVLPGIDSLASLVSDTPSLLMKSIEATAAHVLTTAIPLDTLVLPTGDILLDKVFEIDNASLIATETGNGKVRLIVSIDSGTSWHTWDGTEWDTILPTASAVIAGGMSKAVINALTQTEWALLCGSDDTMTDQIRFGYALSITSITDVAETDSLTLLVDMRGSWDGAILGTDYNYGYPDNNVLRVTLLLNGDYKINY